MSTSIDATTPSSSTGVSSSAPRRDLHDKNLALALEFNSSGEQPLRNRSLEDRFEFIQLCVAAAGFSSFDAMVGQYYTADFNHESILTQQQQRSRHSHLPMLLGSLRKSTQVWTEWEAHGYQYEIIKSVESIIRTERGNFTASQAFTDALSELERLHSGVTADLEKDSSSRVFKPLSKVLQDTVRIFVYPHCFYRPWKR